MFNTFADYYVVPNNKSVIDCALCQIKKDCGKCLIAEDCPLKLGYYFKKR